MSGRASIRDVAALAGVSYQTVSRVLNEPERVRPDTAERVQAAIRELKFRPNRAARSLARNRSGLIGVISVHGSLFGPAQMRVAIEEGARARNYATIAVSLRDDASETLDAAREHLLTLGVEGVVVIAWSEALLELTQRFGPELPTAVVAEGDVPAGVARVTGDNVLGGQLATQALLDGGCKRIGHLAGPADWLEARARQAGFHGLAGSAGVGVVAADWTPEGGYRGIDELLARAPDLDGVFAANDNLAVGALRRLTELGRSVPGDIALVGYDDLELDPYLSVPLASIRQPFTDVGAAAIELLFKLMDDGGPGERILEPTLVRRASLG